MSSNTNTPDRSAAIGVMLMICVAAISSLDAIVVRMLSPEVHPFIIGFTRSLFGLLVLLPYILKRRGLLTSKFRTLHILRAALKLASLIAFFFAFASAPLADVTAIAFTAPIFVTVGAWAFLGETPRRLRIIAVAIGFAGVVVVLRPGGETVLSSGLLFALVGALLTALIQLMLKSMSFHDKTETLVAWNLIATVPIAAIPAALVWTNPSPGAWVLLAIQGIAGALNMSLVTRAMSLADASLLVPIDFLRLPLVAVLAYWIFAEAVPVETWIGGGIIFIATLLMARSARPPRPDPL